MLRAVLAITFLFVRRQRVKKNERRMMPSSQLGNTVCLVFAEIRFINTFARNRPSLGGETIRPDGIVIWELCLVHTANTDND